MAETCMCWGFSCGDGWEPLIRSLSEELEILIRALPEDQRELYAAEQVKEKFGGLRFYMTAVTEQMRDKIDWAEDASYRICEDCGDEGEPRKGGWIRTLCDECDARRKLAQRGKWGFFRD